MRENCGFVVKYGFGGKSNYVFLEVYFKSARGGGKRFPYFVLFKYKYIEG